MSVMQNETSTVKVQTLNLWHNTLEYETRLKALINRLNLDTPEVLFLQEVTFPTTGMNSAEIIAKGTDLNIVALHRQNDPDRTDGVQTGNAILSTLKPYRNNHTFLGELAGYRQELASSSGFIPLTPSLKKTPNSSAVYAWLTTPQGNELLAISAHLSWGVFNENQRLHESIDINNLAASLTHANPLALTVLGISMNSIPDSDSVRFLTGRKAVEDNESFWIDAWEHCNPGETAGETQTPRNVWSRAMAAENGTHDTTKLPKRRIDYIFVRDWVFGQTGSPLSSKIIFTEPLNAGSYPQATVSDHFGVESILYDVTPRYSIK